MSEKKFCDRCGREVKIYLGRVAGQYDRPTSYPFNADLCGDCTDSLRNWLNEFSAFLKNPKEYVKNQEG